MGARPDDNEIQLIAETNFVRLVKRGGWSFVQRQKEVNVIAIVGVSDDQELILVEQFRPPTSSRVIELPAGLAGDIEGSENETLETAARRELLEETGYEAKTWTQLPTVTSSAGLTDERVTLFHAQGLSKTGDGGGVDSEDIVTHKIPLTEIDQWLTEAASRGLDIDSRVFAAIHWANRA